PPAELHKFAGETNTTDYLCNQKHLLQSGVNIHRHSPGEIFMRSQIALFVTILACSIACGHAQAPSNTGQSAPTADMNGMSHDDMKGMPMGQDIETDKSEAAHVMHSM